MRVPIAFALRTLVGPWIAVPAAVLEVANFFQRGLPWRGEGLWTVDWFAIALFIIGPVCAGAAAVDASRLSRPGNIHLVLATPRPTLPYLRAAAWCAGPVVAVHLLAIVTGMIVGGVRQPSTGWGWLAAAALIQCAAIIWYVALGSAIGRFAPPAVAGIAAAGTGFATIYLLGEGGGHDRFELLALGGATVSRLGYVYNGGYLVAQLGVLVVTAASFLLIPLRHRSGFAVPTAAGSLLTAAALGVIAVAPFLLPASRLEASPAPPLRCSGTSPEVCLYSEHERFATSVNGKIKILVRAAVKGGYPELVPKRVEEISRTYRVTAPETAGIEVADDTYVSGRMSLEEVVTELVRPLHCSELYTGEPPTDAYWEREMSLYATWLRLAGVKLDLNDFPVPVRILTPEQVAEIKSDYARCDLAG
ncbi:hypothetical protein [Streptomyces alkaliterrae]|uniref:Uncharacterized protein n=1 Tax=Streptomyces alkaliterrae TaxID=2213162 RepID=A0A5P0YTI9_9ACTN|nr:hypothetical protein [Streptomyces alkaliterrae]MBB1261081.1 hypothetical protein [Streptomyces alkaliterrae]MQS03588.1 hypothetical protein [Streptomyces alkaliterrae]